MFIKKSVRKYESISSKYVGFWQVSTAIVIFFMSDLFFLSPQEKQIIVIISNKQGI